MKRLAFLVLGVFLFTNVKGQSLLDEGLFLKFEYCIQDFFEHEFSKTKDSLSILYGNYSYPYVFFTPQARMITRGFPNDLGDSSDNPTTNT